MAWECLLKKKNSLATRNLAGFSFALVISSNIQDKSTLAKENSSFLGVFLGEIGHEDAPRQIDGLGHSDWRRLDVAEDDLFSQRKIKV